MWCDDKSLQFIDFPEEITIDWKTILSVHVPQHFSMKMAQMTHDFEIMTKFQPTNSTDPHLVQEIVSYFEVAETVHWSLFTLVIVLSLCILVLICFCSYLVVVRKHVVFLSVSLHVYVKEKYSVTEQIKMYQKNRLK